MAWKEKKEYVGMELQIFSLAQFAHRYDLEQK